MARRILNRKELRVENDELERQEAESPEEELDEDEPVKAPKKAAPKRKSRSKVAKEVRLKAFWGVFNQAMAQVAQFEYGQRAEADQKAKELSESKKAQHFVQLIKKVIEE